MTELVTTKKSGAQQENEKSPPSFEQLYKSNYSRVAAIVRQFKFTDAAADDLLQDIFFQSWKRLDSLSDPDAFGAWVATIARNRCLNEIRKKKMTVAVNTQDSFDEEADEIILVADNELSTFHFEHSITLLRELIKEHEGEPRATVARMFYLDELAVKDICTRLDLKQNTVLSHLRRFRIIVSKAMLQLAEEKGLEPYC